MSYIANKQGERQVFRTMFKVCEMMRRERLAAVCGIASLAVFAVSCGEKEVENGFAKVGGKVISRESFDAFRRTKSMYPHALDGAFPGGRTDATFLVETQALFAKAPGGIKREVQNSEDWEWKQQYFPAQAYISEVLDKQLGLSEEAILEYYRTHQDEFEVTKEVVVSQDSVGDSVVTETKDSVYVRPLAEVKPTIVEQLFFTTFPPDEAFWESMQEEGDTTAVDTGRARQRWIREVRADLPNFFMKRVYEDQYGEPMPDSVSEWYGEGKLITPEDLDVILGWLPEGRRESYKNPQGTKFLAEWLLKWKLFAQEARDQNLLKEEEFSEVVDWAKKIEVARAYVEERLQPEAVEQAAIDTAMAKFAYWDTRGTPGVEPDSASLHRFLEQQIDQDAETQLDALIYDIRRDVGVEFLQSDWMDDKGKDPAAILAEADSLLNAGETSAAEAQYNTLSRSFSFTPEGKRALTELAKIQTESGKYRDAIRNYRQYLVTSGETERNCNMFFMVGFIYDEYMDKPENAEINYRWILKNTPECELSDDAEFMLLHLDEPMTSVEELRAEARRQGRKIEDEELTDELLEEEAEETTEEE